MRSNLILILFGAVFLLALNACRRATPAKNYNDTYTSGSLKFVSDDSFEPIVDQELYVFKNDNPEANPTPIYKAENDAVKLLLADSVRFALLSRDLTTEEKNVLTQHNLPTVTTKFASDAIAIIVNQASADTATSVDEIKRMLRGEAKTDRDIVFDNPNSSLVRYLKDFSSQSEFKRKNIYALKSNKEVIEYVSKNPGAIGITGFSWLDDPDADYADAAKKVRTLAVKDENSKTPNQYYKPSQTTLFLKQYPLQRSLYVVNCTGRKGLGMGLELFIAGDKGQRIILRSGLLPAILPEREISIHNNKL
ncbi:PstS family phosphate ABC transporter substrate-binding protein [Mucilaginibacter ginsenosidivorans]|uniref:Phosphate ABC transporter substrate-binding protein n=1 Tax=Mucilaginibacter ginsenosidivorans TaxID=398053 RepID=A0A5B8US06_9SPHI|nr:substrate-binding domain-containing protein [Mucilaginibacter ginsenosidivorans]QEC61181.1 phosphate ABC transporter substrate-binding protein [Mucilaginibacter ginsenosidivorans]